MKRMALSLLLMILVLPAAVSAVGNISVSSSPAGATIYLDGQTTGSVTPATVESVSSGSHTILLKLTGYQDNSQTVQVSDNQTSTVSAPLVAITPAPTISSISPTYGYNSSIVSITCTGTNFISGASVVLAKSGQTNITGSVSSYSSTQLVYTFPITGIPAGSWYIIVTNPDGQSATSTSTFEIRNPTSTATLASITPSSADTNTTVYITSLAGTGFVSTPTIYLKKSGVNDIPGTVTSMSATNIVGNFNLNQRTPGAYQVCVVNSGTDAVCGLTFTITAPGVITNGTISFGSSPSGASVYINATKKGTTPFTLPDLPPGSYFIRMQRADYTDYTTQAIVTSGNTTSVYAYLTQAATYTTTATPTPTPIPTTVTTVKTTKKSTTTAPTPWPSATTQASPVGPLVILGAIGLGFVILRRD